MPAAAAKKSLMIQFHGIPSIISFLDPAKHKIGFRAVKSQRRKATKNVKFLLVRPKIQYYRRRNLIVMTPVWYELKFAGTNLSHSFPPS